MFLGIDLANFYLNTPMPEPEYMRLRLAIIPEEIIIKYNLRDLVDKDGWVYVEIRKGIHGLPQAGILANQLLEKRLSTKGYYQCQHTPGLWRHVWRSIVFCLVVDDFGIKLTHMDDMHHLKMALEEHYTVAVDWKGSLFCGVKLSWDYINQHVTTYMPGYIGRALTNINTPIQRYPNTPPIKRQPSDLAQKFRGWKKTNHLPSRQNKSNGSKTLSEHSSTMDEQSTPPSSLPSAQLLHDNPMEPRL